MEGYPTLHIHHPVHPWVHQPPYQPTLVHATVQQRDRPAALEHGVAETTVTDGRVTVTPMRGVTVTPMRGEGSHP